MKYLKEKIGGRSGYTLIIIGLLLILICFFIVSLGIGRYYIPGFDVLKIILSKVIPLAQSWDENAESIIFTLRLPRIIAAVLVGASLALSGAAYQGVFRNPLVAPDLLGVSSGACIGSALAILLGAGTAAIQVSAFFGGIIAVSLTVSIPKMLKNSSSMMLVLSGIIVGGLMNSIMGIIKYIADPETELAEITYWQMGSIAKVLPQSILAVAPMILLSLVILMILRWKINILSLGEKEAKSLGISVKSIRMVVIVCATMLTACSVCISGTIGWAGLVVPHLGRMIVGPDNRKLLPVSCILGGIFMLFVDTIARTLTSAELPLSILTGLIGAPFYFYLLKKQRMKLS